MSGNRGQRVRKPMTPAGRGAVWILGLLILSAAIVIPILFSTGALTLGATGTTPPTTLDYWQIYTWDALDSSEDNYEIDNSTALRWYRASIINLDAGEIADLTWTDFTFKEADDKLDIDEDYVFILHITQPGFVEQYFSTSPLLFEGKMPLLSLGDNNIYLYNQTEDVSMLAYEKNSMGTTFATTEKADWIISIQCLDADEATGEATNLEGYRPYFDPSANEYQRPIIVIEFNDTASTSYAKLMSSYTNVETANGVFLYIAFDSILVDDGVFQIQLSSAALNDTVATVDISIGYGTADSLTTWDVQT